MSHTFRVRAVAVAASLVIAASGLSASAQAAKPAAGAKAPSASKMSSHSVSGTLEKFDEAGKMLSVHTTKGTETLTLGSTAKIHQGSKMLTPADLASQTGSHVRVDYTERDGQKTAQDVRVAGKAQEKAPKSAKKH